MRVLVDGRWEGGFLDYHRSPADYRLEVFAWLVLERLDDLYFVRPRSPRLVLNYVQDVGPRTALRKIASRRAERFRNLKYLSCGYGRVLEEPVQGSGPRRGQNVVFMATQHPACVERIVVPADLVGQAAGGAPCREAELLHLSVVSALARPEFAAVRAWSPFAGMQVGREAASQAVEEAARALAAAPWGQAKRLRRESPPAVSETRAGTARHSARPRAMLFGYGNYAKTSAVPHVSRWLDVASAHEIDPLQIPRTSDDRAWDTAPMARDNGSHAAYMIASYHGTHADLAVQALEHGAAAVIEKPIATSRAQLDRLLAAMDEADRVFVCFQRRYTPFNRLALQDLGVQRGGPIDYHCIVFEERLPTSHWYRWPSSGSRLLSNGCHWVDHFLWLNDYALPTASEVTVADSGTVNCSVELENGAFFSMALTDTGSSRIGMREYCQLRRGDVTATIEDGRRYRAESGTGKVRRARCDKHEPYRRMYEEIARRVASGEAGDSRASVELSGGLILDLDERLRRLPGSHASSVA